MEFYVAHHDGETHSHNTPNRARTCDLPLIRRLLYRLSYKSELEMEGIDPPTSRMQSGRSTI